MLVFFFPKEARYAPKAVRQPPHKPPQTGKKKRKKKKEKKKLANFVASFIGPKRLLIPDLEDCLLEMARRVGEPTKFGYDELGQSPMISQFGNGGLARDNFRCDEVMIMRGKGRCEDPHYFRAFNPSVSQREQLEKGGQ